MNEETLENLRNIRIRLEKISEFVSDLIEDETYEVPAVNHHSPPAEVEKMVYGPGGMVEVLNKCLGRPWDTKPKNIGLLVEIAKQVPRHVIQQALASMQDKRQANLNPDSKHTKDLQAYFIAALRGKCSDNKIVTSF